MPIAAWLAAAALANAEPGLNAGGDGGAISFRLENINAALS